MIGYCIVTGDCQSAESCGLSKLSAENDGKRREEENEVDVKRLALRVPGFYAPVRAA